MKKSIIIGIFSLIFVASICIIYKNYVKSTQNHDSNILVKVGKDTITKEDLTYAKGTSKFKDYQGRTFSDKEILDELVADKLLLIKAKQLNINYSDQEVRNIYKEMLMQMNSKEYVNGDEYKIDNKNFQRLKQNLEIQKVKETLKNNIDTTLKELKGNTSIVYY